MPTWVFFSVFLLLLLPSSVPVGKWNLNWVRGLFLLKKTVFILWKSYTKKKYKKKENKLVKKTARKQRYWWSILTTWTRKLSKEDWSKTTTHPEMAPFFNPRLVSDKPMGEDYEERVKIVDNPIMSARTPSDAHPANGRALSLAPDQGGSDMAGNLGRDQAKMADQSLVH